MADLLKKLGVLLQSRLNEVIPEQINPATPERRRVSPERLGKNIDREIESLRNSVNDAVEYETKLNAQVKSAEDEIARLNAQADAAVARGDDAAARFALEQLQRAQQRLDMANADLSAHQLVTEDLIRRVNLLDAVVADARSNAQAAEAAKKTAAPPDEAATSQPAARMADVPPKDAKPLSDDDDLAQRRQRLSKP